MVQNRKSKDRVLSIQLVKQSAAQCPESVKRATSEARAEPAQLLRALPVRTRCRCFAVAEGRRRKRLDLQALKRLPNQFLTFLPERLGGFWIDRVDAHSFGHGGAGDLIGDDCGDVAVLAIPASDFVSGSDHRRPY